ncbi:MAG TPA: T9SS type A sorting domain-containing protein [Ignavibacteria bacterium]|nr:T9SS type A sorting domain-containing protein [Ignavibacteria bacterium]HMR39195.1 T9SS type A sorting domain-containing protein [Ignavibacteria bacterium]
MKKLLTGIFIVILFSNLSAADSVDKFKNKIGSFTAKINKAEIELNWTIINPANLNKYKIESKKSGNEIYNSLTEIVFLNFRKKEETDTLSAYYYTFSDNPDENGVYYYKLSVYDIFNKVVASEEIKMGITGVPEIKLNQNSPNPFNPSTLISYQVLVPTKVRCSVYSLTGQFVDELLNAYQSPGTYSIEFNANKYSELSSGIYFYKLETNYTSDIKKMIFTK